MMKNILAAGVLALSSFGASAKSVPVSQPISDKKPCFVVFGSSAINIYSISAVYYFNGKVIVERAVGRGIDTELTLAKNQTSQEGIRGVLIAIENARKACEQ